MRRCILLRWSLRAGLCWTLLIMGGRLPAQVEQLDLVEEPEEIDDRNTYWDQGTLLPVEVSSIANTTGRSLPLVWIAPEGKIVEKGTLVAELDAGAFERDLEPARSQLETATARLAAAESSLQASRESSAAAVEVAERALALATEARERLDRDELALQIRSVEAELTIAEKRLEVALRRVERLKKLPSTVEIEERIEEAEIASLEAKTQTEVARAHREFLTTSARRYKDAERKLEIARRELELRRARTEGSAGVRGAEAAVVAARGEREAEAQKLARIEEVIAGCRMVAPGPGRVIYAEPLEPGIQVSTRVVLLTIVDPTRFRMEVVVPLDIAQRTSTGQRVAVAVDAFPDASFSGRIASIGVERGPRGGGRPRTVTARTSLKASPSIQMAKVTILLDDPDGRLRAGMTAGVTLKLAEPKAEEAERR